MNMSLTDMINDYGCNLKPYTDLNNLKIFISKFNKIQNIDDVKYISCKDDSGVFVIVTNKYVVKLYKQKDYNRIVKLYQPITKTNSFDHIEKIYYYYSIINGLIVHDTYYYINNNNKLKNTINGVINELLVPITYLYNMDVYTNINWSKSKLRKLILDVSKGLDVLHNNDIIHNDATPDNIGLRPADSNFVLFDFGQSSINKTLSYESYKEDINRFLISLMTTYKDTIPYDKFFGSNYLLNIYKYINKTPYTLGKLTQYLKSMS